MKFLNWFRCLAGRLLFFFSRYRMPVITASRTGVGGKATQCGVLFMSSTANSTAVSYGFVNTLFLLCVGLIILVLYLAVRLFAIQSRSEKRGPKADSPDNEDKLPHEPVAVRTISSVNEQQEESSIDGDADSTSVTHLTTKNGRPYRQVAWLIEQHAGLEWLLQGLLREQYEVTLTRPGENEAPSDPVIIFIDSLPDPIKANAEYQRVKTSVLTRDTPVILLVPDDSQLSAYGIGETGGAVSFCTLTQFQRFFQSLFDIQETNKSDPRQHPMLLPAFRQNDEALAVAIVCAIVEHLSDSSLSVPKLSHLLGMSQTVLYRKVRSIFGISVTELIKTIKLRKAAEMLLAGHYNVSEVSSIIGFDDRRYFTKAFKKQYGVTPREYGKTDRVKPDPSNEEAAPDVSDDLETNASKT